MGKELDFYLKDVLMNEFTASQSSLDNLREKAGFELPQDYLEFMKEFNGGEGEVGNNSWLCLFPIEDLIQTNEDYILLMQEIPDYFLFGKDAADTGFAFHKSNQTIHSFGLMSNFKTDKIESCGAKFKNFLEYLYNR
jgi:hypothetical protein